MNLSKSKYVRGLQCPKQLWLDKYKPEEYRVDESTQSAFNTGNIVGDLARKYFGKCALVDFDRGISLFVSYWGADWKYAPSIEVCARDMNRHEVDRKIEICSYDDLKEARKFIETVIA